MMGKENPGNEDVKFSGLFWQGETAKGCEGNREAREARS